MKIYFADEWPHGDKMDWIWDIVWMGSAFEGTIHIRRGMPWWLFWWVLIHEVIHVLDTKTGRQIFKHSSWGVELLWLRIWSGFWSRYERISLLVSWRWSCKQKGLI